MYICIPNIVRTYGLSASKVTTSTRTYALASRHISYNIRYYCVLYARSTCSGFSSRQSVKPRNVTYRVSSVRYTCS